MTKLIILFGFLLAFAAGILTASRFMPPEPQAYELPTDRPREAGEPTTRPGGPPFMRRGFLPRELNLTPEQQSKMREIWSNVGIKGPREMDEKRRELGETKDAQVAKLIPADRQAEFQKIEDDFNQKVTALDSEFRNAFDSAVRQTEALLTDEQKKTYEAIRNRMQPPDGHGFGPDGNGPPGQGRRGPHGDDHGRHGPHEHGPGGPMGGFDRGPDGPPSGPPPGGNF